jgi:hypothetical protein
MRRALSIFALLALIVGTLIAFCSDWAFPDKDLEKATDRMTIPANMNIVHSAAPKNIYNVGEGYRFGRYAEAIPNLSMHQLTLFQKIFQKKTWHFVSFSDNTQIWGLAVANMGYIESAFMYYCNTRTGAHDKVSALLPGGLLAALPSISSVDPSNCSVFRSPFNTLLEISICYSPSGRSWRVVGSATMEKGSVVDMDVNLRPVSAEPGNQFAMLYPLGSNR